MEKPIKQFIEDCVRVDLVVKNGYKNEKTAADLMNTVKVYVLLTMRKPLVQDIVIEKHLSSGLGEKGLAKKSVNGIPKKLKDLSLINVHFTDGGLAYQKVYLEEVKEKGQSWFDFSVRVVKDTAYYQELLDMVEKDGGCSYGASVAVNIEQQIAEEKENILVHMSSVGELKAKSNTLFRELASLCAAMENKSHDLIEENNMANENSKGYLSDFVLESHRKFYQGSVSNEHKLREIVVQTKHSFDYALSIMEVVEGLERR